MNFVKTIIDEWDPIDLLSFAPNDEYDYEIERIQKLLGSVDKSEELADEIFRVFDESFGKDVFLKGMDECRRIAEMLLSLKNELRKNSDI